MKKEIENWLKQAKADTRTSENSLKSRDFYASAFWAQQAVEKALKALYIKDKNELIKTHSISKIAKLLHLPDNLLNKVALIEQVYQETRYPDVSTFIPAEEFKENDATEILDYAMDVIAWIERKIK